MVRDVQSTSVLGNVKTYTDWPEGPVLVSNVSGGADGGVYYVIDKSRADLIHSDHINPTTYYAHRYKAKPQPWVIHTISPTQRRWVGPPSYWEYAGQTKKGLTGFYPSYDFGMEDCSPLHPNFPDWVIKSSRGKVLSSLNNSDVNLGQFLGELPETGQMMVKSSITVMRAYRAARRGQWSRIPRLLGVNKVKNLPKSAAGAWFAYKFGWMPYLTDIYNGQEEIRKQLNRPVFARVTRTTSTAHLMSTVPASYEVEPKNIKKGCTVGVAYRVSNSTLAGLNSLGLTNPLAIAWELLPLSFVADWFVPVGNFLQQLSGPMGLTFIAGYETRFAYGDMNVRTKTVQDGWYGSPRYVKVESFGFHRRMLSSWPTPSLTMKFGLDLNQVATAIGLILQRL